MSFPGAAAGLEIRSVELFPLGLLTVRGLLADEGIRCSLGVVARLLSWPEARARARQTRAVHRRFGRTLSAVVVVAAKPGKESPSQIEEVGELLVGEERVALEKTPTT